jgi:hypothetical protein
LHHSKNLLYSKVVQLKVIVSRETTWLNGHAVEKSTNQPKGGLIMSNSFQESSALAEILNRLKAMEARAEKFEAKVDKRFDEVGYELKLAGADRQAIRREMDNRFKEVDKKFESVASANAMREGFMAAAADREAIRFEMREGFRIAAERHQAFQNKTEASLAEVHRIIPEVANMLYQKIEANHQEAQAFQKNMVGELEDITEAIRKFNRLEREVDELKKDKALKDAIIRRLEQRLA